MLSAVICHACSVHLHLLCRLLGFPFAILNRYIVLCPMAEVMLEVDVLKGRPVHKLAANGWKRITYHGVR